MARLFKQLHHNGIALGLILIAWRIWRVIFSRIYSRILSAPFLDIGSGCRIKGLRYIRFGANISIFRHAWIEAVYEYHGKQYSPCLIIGDRVTMSSNVHISCLNKVRIGADVLLGSNIYISDHNHGSYRGIGQCSPQQAPSARPLSENGSINIGANVWVGDNVVIIGNVNIGEGAVVGANSVVLSDVPAGAIVAGAPARIIRQFDSVECAWKLARRANE